MGLHPVLLCELFPLVPYARSLASGNMGHAREHASLQLGGRRGGWNHAAPRPSGAPRRWDANTEYCNTMLPCMVVLSRKRVSVHETPARAETGARDPPPTPAVSATRPLNPIDRSERDYSEHPPPPLAFSPQSGPGRPHSFRTSTGAVVCICTVVKLFCQKSLFWTICVMASRLSFLLRQQRPLEKVQQPC